MMLEPKVYLPKPPSSFIIKPMRWTYFVILIIAAILFIVNGPMLKNNVLAFIRGVGNWDFFDSRKIQNMEIENKNLKTEIWRLKNQIIVPDNNLLKANIYAAYPFNNKNLISINVGAEQGIRRGMPVTVGGELLLGETLEVFKNYSVVKTIFSPDSELPVRIGSSKTPALLSGGPALAVTMIANNKPVANGQIIFSANQNLPYGLKIGEVINVKNDSATGVFKKAGVKLDYDFNDLTEVVVILWTAD